MIQYSPKTINITFNYSYYVTLFFAVAVGFVFSVSFKGDIVSLAEALRLKPNRMACQISYIRVNAFLVLLKVKFSRSLYIVDNN